MNAKINYFFEIITHNRKFCASIEATLSLAY